MTQKEKSDKLIAIHKEMGDILAEIEPLLKGDINEELMTKMIHYNFLKSNLITLIAQKTEDAN